MNRDDVRLILLNNKEELEKKYGITKIGFFGSYVKDQQNSQSDIDIVVELKDADLFLLSTIKDYLQNILEKDVDIIRLRKNMNEYLKERINSEAIYV